jgi:hypothetical protein
MNGDHFERAIGQQRHVEHRPSGWLSTAGATRFSSNDGKTGPCSEPLGVVHDKSLDRKPTHAPDEGFEVNDGASRLQFAARKFSLRNDALARQ